MAPNPAATRTHVRQGREQTADTTTATAKVRKPRAPKPDINVDDLTVQTVSAEQATVFAPRNKRSDAQVKLDNAVRAAYNTWVAAGRPTKVWTDFTPSVIPCKPEHETTIKQMVRSAGTLHGLKIRFGKTVANSNGQTLVAFVVVARTSKDKEETSGE